jgi:hypothetical protein
MKNLAGSNPAMRAGFFFRCTGDQKITLKLIGFFWIGMKIALGRF